MEHDHELMVLYHPVEEETELSTKMDALRTLVASQGYDVSDVFHWGGGASPIRSSGNSRRTM